MSRSKPSIAADRRALVARGYDKRALAQYESDCRAGLFTDVVRDYLQRAAKLATLPQLNEQIVAQQRNLNAATADRNMKAANLYRSVVELLKAEYAARGSS